MNNHYGIKAQNYFIKVMNEIGLKYKFDDSWYDFTVEGQKVEVKSCQLSIKQTKKKGRKKIETYRSGKFHFTEEKNRKLQYKNDVWVCFILRHEYDFMILGFVKAKKLKKRKQICIHKLMEIGFIGLNEWIECVVK